MKNLSDNLLTRLLTADICCRDCGQAYGSYSVGCSSTWQAECPICGETKGCTEVRDWGYLTKGIHAEKSKIKEQSLEVANYMKCQEEIASQEYDETVSYEQGEIACMFTEAEVAALAELAEDHCDNYPGAAFESLWEKIEDLYQDYCIKYELSPALKKFHELYGTWGMENEVEQAKWEVFRDAFHAGADYSKEVKVGN